MTDPEDLVVYSGSVDLESDDLVETPVADLHVSEDFNDPVELASDWALLLLDEPVDVEPVTVDQDPAEFDELEVAGWGSTGSSYPTVARWAEVPFVDDDDGDQILVGIVSWGEGCAEPGFPGVYAEVADFNDPIEQAIEEWDAA